MKRFVKKGFTLVELVVVIAIIAILSGVGVAVYVGLTNKAKATADSEIITQLNKHLKTQLVSEGRNVTCYDAYEDAFEIGFDLAKMNPSAGEYYVWDEVNDLFAVTNGDEVVAQDKDNSLTNIKYKRWIFTKTINPNETRSQYLTSKTYTGVANVKAGFDAGQNLNISEVNYVNDKASQEVIIRTTTFGTKVSVNGYVDTKDATHKTGDVVTHYGFAGLVDVVRCALSSYEEHGTIGRITANATADVIAHVAIKKDATVYQVVENEDDNSYITVDSGATVYDNEGNKIEGAVDSRNNAADDDMFAEDAKDCEHVDTHIFSDSQFMYEVCDTCGYTVITVIDQVSGTSKKDVVDENGGETIVPISTYTTDGKTVKIEDDKVVITEEAEPTVPTPVVDPEQPITKCEHDFGELVVISEPTREAEGSASCTCKKCGYTFYQVIPKLPSCEHEYAVVKDYWELDKDNNYIFYEDWICTKCGDEYTHKHDLAGMYCNTCKHMIPLVFDTLDLANKRIKSENVMNNVSLLEYLEFWVLEFGGGTSLVEKDDLYASDLNYMACFDSGRIDDLISSDLNYNDNHDGTYTRVKDGEGNTSEDAIAYLFNNYLVDFTLSFNVDVDLRCLMLAGYYNNMAFAIKPALPNDADNLVPAGTEVPVMGSFAGGQSPITYDYLTYVSFLCGLYIDANAAVQLTPGIISKFATATVTLRLVMYESGHIDDRMVVNTLVVSLPDIIGLPAQD